MAFCFLLDLTQRYLFLLGMIEYLPKNILLSKIQYISVRELTEAKSKWIYKSFIIFAAIIAFQMLLLNMLQQLNLLI